jgi:Copper type II ascorbate-dependent monooxygenase, C-terminal domain/Copper type II ascorbate-dependent monooxygenase, N-terminal domain
MNSSAHSPMIALSIGISEAGGMKGADIVLFEAGTKKLIDSHVLDANAMPIKDDCQSWHLISSFVGHEFIIFEASRAIDSGDTQDRPFQNDAEAFTAATRVIGAWGDSVTPSFHGDNYAKGALRFNGVPAAGGVLENFRSVMQSEAEGSFKIGATDYAVPDWTRTTYGDFCLSSADLKANGVPLDGDRLHILGIEPRVDPRAAPYVHHFLVYGSTVDCVGGDGGPPLHELIFGWSVGGLPLELPPSVGIPLGDAGGGYVSFRIQIHYDNPFGVSNIIDSSGVVAHYTSRRRQHDMGILQVGDPFVAVQPLVLSESGGPSQHSFGCSGACTGSYFQSEVTVFAEAIHMHASGRMGSNEIFRNGTVVHRAVSEYFDFVQQGGIMIQQDPYPLLPGDGFRLTCSYDADVGAQWGANSHDEMCIAYLFYYPRQTTNVGIFQVQPTCAVNIGGVLPGCEAEHSVTPNYNHFDRTFGIAVADDASCQDFEDEKGHGIANIPSLGWLKRLSGIFSALTQSQFSGESPMLRSSTGQTSQKQQA